jgi:RNA 3'-terminal phosphate cyclase
MDTTVTLEFTSDMEQHLRILEQQLKHIRDVNIDLVEARDHKAPSLFAIAIGKSGDRAEKAAQTVAQVLHDFLHTDTAALSHKTISLVTIEGERINIEPMSMEEIKSIIVAARQGDL